MEKRKNEGREKEKEEKRKKKKYGKFERKMRDR
jgi:hypothetical protein